MFLIIIPVIIPYCQSLGLSMEQVFQLQAFFGICVALMEVPTGYMADLWGRKKTLITGSLFWAVSATILAASQNFYHLLGYMFCAAIGTSLVSGTDTAFLYDTLKNHEVPREKYTASIASLQFFELAGEASASIIGGLLALISLKTSAWAFAFVMWVPFIIALTLREPIYKKMDRKQHKENFHHILNLFNKDNILKFSCLNLLIWGLSTFIAVWVFQKHWQLGQISLGYFGIIWAVYNITVGLTGKRVEAWEKKYGPACLMVVLSLLPIFGYLGLAWLSGWFGVVAGLLFQVSRGMTHVLFQDAINWRIDSKYRATVNSFNSLAFRLGFALVGPAVGHGIDKWSMAGTMTTLACVFLALFFIFTLPLIKKIKVMGGPEKKVTPA